MIKHIMVIGNALVNMAIVVISGVVALKLNEPNCLLAMMLPLFNGFSYKDGDKK